MTSEFVPGEISACWSRIWGPKPRNPSPRGQNLEIKILKSIRPVAFQILRLQTFPGGYIYSFSRGIRIWGQKMPIFRARRENIGKTYPRKKLEIALYSLINPFKGPENLKNLKNCSFSIFRIVRKLFFYFLAFGRRIWHLLTSNSDSAPRNPPLGPFLRSYSLILAQNTPGTLIRAVLLYWFPEYIL